MINLIYRLKPKEKGSGLHAIYLQKTYANLFKSINFDEDQIPTKDRLWILHNPFFYNNSLISRKDDYSCLRQEFCSAVPGKHLTNGFSYLKRFYGKYHGFFPTIYQSHFKKNDNISIGYYARDCRSQSNAAFCDFVKSLPQGIPIMTMGQKECIKPKLASNPNWTHTYSNDIFWSRCSHYFYYRCSDEIDPFPHTLLEAIQSQHTIISPIDPRRDFSDGIDDLLSFIPFYTEFNDDVDSYSLNGLDASKYWMNIMENVVSNGFCPVEMPSHTFYDWFCRQS